jgi:hypothetical protein
MLVRMLLTSLLLFALSSVLSNDLGANAQWNEF